MGGDRAGRPLLSCSRGPVDSAAAAATRLQKAEERVKVVGAAKLSGGRAMANDELDRLCIDPLLRRQRPPARCQLKGEGPCNCDERGYLRRRGQAVVAGDEEISRYGLELWKVDGFETCVVFYLEVCPQAREQGQAEGL